MEMSEDQKLRPIVKIDGISYTIDMRRMHELVETFEDVVSACELREDMERMGEWTPELEDGFGGMLKDARRILGTPRANEL